MRSCGFASLPVQLAIDRAAQVVIASIRDIRSTAATGG
jgi:hypothetical protein